MIKWYNVKKCIPEAGHTYLLCNEQTGCTCIGEWSVPDSQFHCFPPNEKAEVTHWAYINYPSTSYFYRWKKNAIKRSKITVIKKDEQKKVRKN